MSEVHENASDVASSWPIISGVLKKFEPLLKSPLSDQNLPAELSAPIDKEWSIGTTAKVKANASAAITILNNEEDKDTASVWSKDVESGLPSPLIQASKDAPYLKYSVEVGANLEYSESKTFRLPVSAEAKGTLNLGIHCYKPKVKTSTLGKALEDDHKQMRAPFLLSDIRSMTEGEALAMIWSGGLTVKATVDWSDIIAPTIAGLRTPPGSTRLLSIDADAFLKTEIDFTLQDTFKLVFFKSPEAQKPLVVEIRKLDGREIGIGVSAGLTIQSSLSDAAKASLQKLADMIASKILDLAAPAFGQIKEWVDSANNLPPDLHQAANEISVKLLGSPVNQLDGGESHLKSALDRWLKGIRDKAEATAKRRIEVGAAFTYRRIKSSETLIRTTFKRSEVKAKSFADIHAELIAGKSSLLQEHARTSSDPEFDFFLKSATQKSVLKFSLGISIGDLAWFSKTETLREMNWSENVDGFLKPSFTINASKSSGSNKDNTNVMIGASAAGREFQDRESLSLDNLDFSITLNHTNIDSKIDDDEFVEYLDTARIWGAFPNSADALKEAVKEIKVYQKNGGKLKFNTMLRLTDEGITKLLATPIPGNDELFGQAIALSLFSYRWEDSFNDLDLRVAGYAEAATHAFKTAERGFSNADKTVSIARDSLTKLGLHDTAQIELKAQFASRPHAEDWIKIGNRPHSLSYLRNDFIAALCHRNHDSIVELKEIIDLAALISSDSYRKYDSAEEYQYKIMKGLGLLSNLRTNKALFRSFGAYLNLRAAHMSAESRLKLIETTLHISELQTDGTEKALVLV